MGLPVYEQLSPFQRPSLSASASQQPPFNRLFTQESQISTYDTDDYTEMSTNNASQTDECNTVPPHDYLQRRISTDPLTGERIDYAFNELGELRNANGSRLTELQLMSANDAITHLLAHTTLLLDRHNQLSHRHPSLPMSHRHSSAAAGTQSHHIGYIPAIPTNSTQHVNLTPEQQHVILSNVLNELVSAHGSDVESYDVESSTVNADTPTPFTPHNTQSLSTQTLSTASLVDVTPQLAHTARRMSPTNEQPLTPGYWNTTTRSTSTSTHGTVRS